MIALVNITLSVSEKTISDTDSKSHDRTRTAEVCNCGADHSKPWSHVLLTTVISILLVQSIPSVNSQCSRVVQTDANATTTPRPATIPDGAPTWFAECIGYGCRSTEQYVHTKCCVENMLEAELVACMSNEYVHVIFSGSGRITLTSAITALEGLILDGTWYDVVIAGHQIKLNSNSIVRRIGFEASQNNGLGLELQYRYAWIHKCTFGTMSGTTGKQIAVSKGFTGITISNSKFYDSTPAVTSDTVSPIQISLHTVYQGVNKDIQVSMHNNYFSSFRAEAPYIRFAYMHFYNNVVEGWSNYGVGCSMRASCFIEKNIFSNSTSPSRNVINIVTPGDVVVGYVRMENNDVGTGGVSVTNGNLFVPGPPYTYTALDATASLYSTVTASAGAGFDVATIL